MKEDLRALCDGAETPLLAQHRVREYVQARILQSLDRAGGMESLAFHGGTALRFLYGIPRYSEDLDFALERGREKYDFRALLLRIRDDFEQADVTAEIKVSDKGVVHKAFVRFRGLPYELGLSPHKTQVLAVKLEVDTNPPAGAGLAKTSLTRYVPLTLQHHDRATLFSGKLHAVLQRAYPKGRDMFDLWWYLTQPDWPEPNLAHLNAALAQSGWPGPELTPENWRDPVRQRVVALDWEENVMRDLRAFIIDPASLAGLNKAALLDLLA